MRFDPDFRPFVAPKNIYIVPLSLEPSRCQVLVPANLSKKLLDILIQDKLKIRQFQGCPPVTEERVRAQLQHSCDQGPGRYSYRTTQMIVAGTALTVLGIINWAFPDPLPLADEILMVGAGVGIGLAGYLYRRRNLPLLKEKAAKAINRLSGLSAVEDPLLTRIHKAICALSAPDYGPTREGPVDLVEAESKWLVDYLDLNSLLDSKAITIDALALLLEALSAAFPLARFFTLERKLRQDPTNPRIRKARNKLADHCGLSREAFTVYAELYNRAGQILSERGSTDGRSR
jgi:hypothetical protein